MSAKCNLCESPIIWDQPYVKGSRPKNEDGSVHSCKKEDTPAPKESSKTPNTILEECITFSETFKDITDAKFDSLVRLYNTRVMQK